jgi:hypothetical protein
MKRKNKGVKNREKKGVVFPVVGQKDKFSHWEHSDFLGVFPEKNLKIGFFPTLCK